MNMKTSGLLFLALVNLAACGSATEQIPAPETSTQGDASPTDELPGSSTGLGSKDNDGDSGDDDDDSPAVTPDSGTGNPPKGAIKGTSTECSLVDDGTTCKEFGAFFYQCHDVNFQPEGLTCFKTQNIPGVCCTERKCVRNKQVDGACSADRNGFSCGAGVQQPASCLPVENQYDFVCCPK